MEFKYKICKVDWENLPKELLTAISQQLTFLEDVIRFSIVCKSWQSAVASGVKPSIPPRFPVLMHIQTKGKEGESHQDNYDLQRHRSFGLISRGLFVSLEKGKKTSTTGSCMRHFESNVWRIKLSEVSYRRCLCSNFGWLIALHTDLHINLWHPFSGYEIKLPPNPNFDDLCDSQHPAFSYLFDPHADYEPKESTDIFIRKAVLSSNPLHKTTGFDYEKRDCVIMAIFSEAGILAFARPGDKAWTKVDVPSHYYHDIIYYKQKFYAVDCKGVLVLCDLNDDEAPRASVIAPSPEGMIDSFMKYLVESSGVILLVLRARTNWYSGTDTENKNEPPYWTYRFRIFKLEECSEVGSGYRYKWVQVNNLGRSALFIGTSSSSVCESGIMGSCKANCLYFTDDFQYEKGHDMGAFNVGDSTVEHYFLHQTSSYCSIPFWYV